MKVTDIPGLLAFVASTSATYQCPVSPSSGDAQAIMYGLSLQTLLSQYYAAIPINASFYSTLPSPTMPMTDFLANTMGLAVQAKLGVEGLQQAASDAGGSLPSCHYKYPVVTDAKSHFMNAYNLEATMCGAFIGLAGYVQSPQAAFLMARLAAEHGIHASYIGSHMEAVVFPSNSTMLTPAFTPEMVSMTGMGVGSLGAYLNNCVQPPAAPCGADVTIGSLGATLSGEGSKNVMANGTAMVGSLGTMGTGPSSTRAVPFTGTAAGVTQPWCVAAGIAGVAAAMLA